MPSRCSLVAEFTEEDMSRLPFVLNGMVGRPVPIPGSITPQVDFFSFSKI